jgi:hypothetical protein
VPVFGCDFLYCRFVRSCDSVVGRLSCVLSDYAIPGSGVETLPGFDATPDPVIDKNVVPVAARPSWRRLPKGSEPRRGRDSHRYEANGGSERR